jgi:hypothetical protein
MPLRRLTACCALAALAFVAAGGSVHAQSGNPIQVENAKHGTRAWRLRPLLNQHLLEGYASEVSVLPGQTVHLHVSSSARLHYQVRVLRMGWYGGTGARLMPCATCRAHAAAPQQIPQPDSGTGLLSLSWPVTDVVHVARNWVSGYYLADLVVQTKGGVAHGSLVPFIVREPPTRDATILVQASVNTWEAYNAWGGRSLYWNHTGVGDDHASFNRPYNMAGAPRSGGPAANLPTAWELSLVRFLERNGYDAAYTTDVDTAADPAELLRHKLDMTSGHDEYWTKEMRDGFEAARDAGVSLAFVGANTGYWQMRYEDNARTIVEYRTADRDPEPDPALKTVQFRQLGRPECELEGVQYGEIGDWNYTPAVAAGTPPDPWFQGTGLSSLDTLFDLVGYEYDGITPGCQTPGPLTDLFTFSNNPNHPRADAVRYRAPSGATVFSAGSIRFANALDPLSRHYDRRLQRFMTNALGSMLR